MPKVIEEYHNVVDFARHVSFEGTVEEEFGSFYFLGYVIEGGARLFGTHVELNFSVKDDFTVVTGCCGSEKWEGLCLECMKPNDMPTTGDWVTVEPFMETIEACFESQGYPYLQATLFAGWIVEELSGLTCRYYNEGQAS